MKNRKTQDNSQIHQKTHEVTLGYKKIQEEIGRHSKTDEYMEDT